MAEPTLIAHRGFAGEHPENTLRAVRRAGAVAPMIEVDVRRCGSGEVVVVHDEHLERLTGESGPVLSYAAEELAAMDVLGSGEGIPTLTDVLAELPDGVGLNVELKEAGIAADVLEILDGHDGEVLLSAFEPEVLEEAREAAPEVPRALLFSRRPRQNLAAARGLGCTAIHPKKWLVLRSRLVRRAHEAGLRVNAWTIGSGRMGRLLRRAGVDGLIADHPDV